MLRKPRILRSEDDLGYLLRVLRNTFFSTRRTAARRPQTTPLPDDLDLVEDRSAIRPESRIESAELYGAISALPDDFRDALVAIDVIGLSYREAAKALEVREATITTRLHRARQRVARTLEPEPTDSGTSRRAALAALGGTPGVLHAASFCNLSTGRDPDESTQVWPARRQVTTRRPPSGSVRSWCRWPHLVERTAARRPGRRRSCRRPASPLPLVVDSYGLAAARSVRALADGSPAEFAAPSRGSRRRRRSPRACCPGTRVGRRRGHRRAADRQRRRLAERRRARRAARQHQAPAPAPAPRARAANAPP